MYQKAKDIDMLEQEYEYKSDEESIYKSFEHDPKGLPIPVTKKFPLNSESSFNKKQVKDMLKRFCEKTQTYEYMVQFKMTVEKTDESTISLQGNTPGHLIDQKERRRYVRKELREFNKQETFKNSNEKNLFNFLIDLFTKSNQLLNIINQDEIDDKRHYKK